MNHFKSMLATSVALRKPAMFLIACIPLLCLVIATSALGNGDTVPSYVSVRSLDHYGNAVQLAHAKEATQRYGRSVVVAVVETYEQKNNPGEEQLRDQQWPNESRDDPSSSFLVVVSLGKSPILHPIQLPLDTDDSSSSLLAICFTGVRGDANWLLQQIQKHAADVWERYDTAAMSVPVVAHVVSRLLGRFASQPEKREWQSSLGLPGKHDSEDDRQSSWSRPLGVQTMVLSLRPSFRSEQHLSEPGLLIVEPSGRILNSVSGKSGRVSLGAMGKSSDKVRERLRDLLRGGPRAETTGSRFSLSSEDRDEELSSSPPWEDCSPNHDECRDELIRILLEEATNTNTGRNNNENNLGSGGDIMVESYYPDRGRIERRLFRYQNGHSFAPV